MLLAKQGSDNISTEINSNKMSFPFIGKEQELLDAARTGNLATITKLVTTKPRKSVVGGGIGQKITSFLKSVNVNCTDKNSYTPLHHAAVNGYGEVVEALLKVEAQPGLKDNQGCTPVHLAAWSGKPDIVLQLLEAGTDEASNSVITPVHVNQQNNNGDTALHCAAQYGHIAVVDVLLQKNANPTIRNLDEFAPLDLAAQYGHREVVHLILLSHPDLSERPLFNHSPLHLAAGNGHKEIVEKLLDNGFSIHTVIDSGTALHEAALHGKLDVVKFLLDRGIDVDQRDQKGLTVLELLSAHKAQQKAFDAIVQTIKDHVAKQNEDPGTYETLASCSSGGKPMAAVKPLPPEKPKKPEKPVTPDKPLAAPRNTVVGSSPEHDVQRESDVYAALVKNRDQTQDKDVSNVPTSSGPAPPPLPPRSSIFPPEDRTPSSPNLDTRKPEGTSPELSPRLHQGAPKKPPRQKPPRNTVCESPTKVEENVPTVVTTPPHPPPPPPHKTDPPFPELYSSISDPPSVTSDPVQAESTSQNASENTTISCSSSKNKVEGSCDTESQSSPTHASQPAIKPKPSLPPRSQSAKLDNSVHPETGKQVNQDFYMEMKGVNVKPRPVSEVKPQRQSDNELTPDEVKQDHYGILFPNLKTDQSNKSKKPELRRMNTAPEESIYVGPSPVTAVDKFRDKHGLLKRAHTAPEESVYTPMSAVSKTEDASAKENEYAEIPERSKSPTSPKSPTENVYASISDTKADIETTMLSQLSEFSSTVSQNNKGDTSPSADQLSEVKSEAGVSCKPNDLQFTKQKTNTPLTPTGYVQPPTPDFPPPSPATALMGIELKIQEMIHGPCDKQLGSRLGITLCGTRSGSKLFAKDAKRKSRDITTLTDNSFEGPMGQGQSSRSEKSEEKVSSSDSSNSNQKSDIATSKGDALIKETVVEETNEQSPVETEHTGTEFPDRKAKETTVTVIQTRVSEVIPESSIPDISVIKTESRVSVGERTEPTEDCESKDSEMFRRKKSKDSSAEKGKGDSKGTSNGKKESPPKKGEKPKVMAKPSSKVVQKSESEGTTKKSAIEVEKINKEVVKKSNDVMKGDDDKKTAKEANGAIPKDSPVLMRRKTEVDMFAGLKRGSTIGLLPKERSNYHDAIIKNATENRQSMQAALLNPPPTVMEKEEDIDFDQVMASIDSEVAKAPVAQDSVSFDDAEEWAKIADIMSSFGGDLTPSFTAPTADFSEEAFEAYMDQVLSTRERGAGQMQSVGEWLETIGMGQYENQFITNGFDNLDFLGPNILEEQDLEQIKVLNHEHRRKVLQAAQSLPHLQTIDPKSPPSSVEEWLLSLQLPGYLETFTHHGYDTMEKVQSILWDLQLRTVLDISMLGHRKRILASLGERSPDKVNNKRPSLSSLSPDKAKSHLGDLDFYKDYTGVKPVSSSEEDIKETMAVASSEEEEDVFSKTGQQLRDNSIHVRPPHMAQTSSPARQWRHNPEMLIKGCCNYTAQYLGSTVVPELTGGVESTRAGITKLKKSKDMLAKIPIIMLSISYKGVKFIDAKSKKVICDHDISNIFCACQDTENLNFFAYITRDIETSRHYCHVFSVKSPSLAHDIILTLGESFEVAYQIALKDKSRQEAMQLDRMMSQSDAEDTYSVSSKMSTNTV